MHKSTPSIEVDIHLLREAYAALNRNDIHPFVQLLDPRIEWIETDLPQGGTYRGLSTVEAHLLAARATWAEGTCEPQRFAAAGDRIIVFLHVHVRLKHETAWREGHIADVFTFRNGKAIEKRSFADRRRALEWVGVEASDEN